MNVERLLAVKQAILDHPEQVRMERWVCTADSPHGDASYPPTAPNLLENCGTAGCIGGWLISLFAAGTTIPQMGWRGLAAEIAGLPTGSSSEDFKTPTDCLFVAAYWPSDLALAYRRARSGSQRARIVAERIDRFLLEHNAVIPEPSRASLGEPAPESSGVR